MGEACNKFVENHRLKSPGQLTQLVLVLIHIRLQNLNIHQASPTPTVCIEPKCVPWTVPVRPTRAPKNLFF